MIQIRDRGLWKRVMEKGRQLEPGTRNRLTGAEIADVMERFGMGAFQVQVWRDLAAARYKLYDATGTWLDSERHIPAATYEEVRSAAMAYLDETIAPDYFVRLRAGLLLTPRLHLKVPNYVTRNFAELPEDEQLEAMAEFHRQSLRKPDWIYSLKGGKYFAAENEAGGYTLMLAEDY